jgi:5'-nucleotidase (lipoprotein e(P4) family)
MRGCAFWIAAPLGLSLLAACATPRRLPDSVHWVRNAAEYQAAARQAFRFAERIAEERALGRAPSTWGVIADADETLLDNSQYQKERAALGKEFDRESWREWCARRAATAVPGSVEFAATVHRLGGRLVVVTNRSVDECPDTEANLKSLGLASDAILCRPDSSASSKEERFERVRRGDAAPGLGPLDVVLFVGDNIFDFPGLDQDARLQAERLREFGTRFVVIPNPMYGTWRENPRR